MGSNSSSAALRSEDAFGSLASMGGRKLKKKPVLVVDPEELAQAYQLFQQGAAEQMGEYEPEQRPRATVSLFGLAPMSDEGDDGRFAHPLAPLNDDDEDQVIEAEAPAPEQVLALTRAREPKAPRANIFGSLPDSLAQEPDDSAPLQTVPAPPAREPAPIAQKVPVADQSLPKPRLVRDYEDIAPGFSHREPAPPAPPQQTPPAGASAPTLDLASQPMLDDGVASVILFEDEQAARPAVETIETAPIVQSSLRARLVREDVCLAQPRPSLLQRVVGLLQRWYSALTGR